MKKLVGLFASFAFMLNMAVAQEATKAATKSEPKKAVLTEDQQKAEKAQHEAKAIEAAKAGRVQGQSKVASGSTSVAPEKEESTVVHTKKDGTPDKRYKENKATVPTKKDGTPDMRYKENKQKAAEKKN